MGTSNYQQLRVWQTGMELARRVYQLTQGFPAREGYGLSSQMQRAAVSIPANLAEGHTRGSSKEFLRYVVIAHGSLAELETMLMLTRDLQYAGKDAIAELLSLCEGESKMVASLRRRLKEKIALRQK